jgi:oligopeptide/dipeptide ABC transporter ATP-binding protein
MTGAPPPLVECEDLVVRFRAGGGLLGTGGGSFNAVDGVSLRIAEGESFGLVGESGCGKTTLGRAILRVHQPHSGVLRFAGQDITAMRGRRLRELRRGMQMVFQDPYSSLDPRMRVEQIVGEPIRTHETGRRGVLRARVREALEAVGIDPGRLSDYPHQFSGGQRQRIGIARALAIRPRFIVCDEATSALDVSVRAQILTLLADLRRRHGLTYLMISHDLGSLRYLCDRIGVMYLGRLVEVAPVSEIFARPRHPYTRSLLSAMPIPDPRLERARRRIVLSGDVPSPMAVPSGCCFHTRCWLRQRLGTPARCQTEVPRLGDAAPGQVACHFADDPAARDAVA